MDDNYNLNDTMKVSVTSSFFGINILYIAIGIAAFCLYSVLCLILFTTLQSNRYSANRYYEDENKHKHKQKQKQVSSLELIMMKTKAMTKRKQTKIKKTKSIRHDPVSFNAVNIDNNKTSSSFESNSLEYSTDLYYDND